MKAISVEDYRQASQRRLPAFLFEYIDGGSHNEVTLRRNVADLAEVMLRQRVLQDVSSIDLTTSLFARQQSLPVALGPIGLAGMSARRGEVQAARAAALMQVPFCLSTVSACSLEEVVGATEQPLWLQLYVMRDRGFMRDLLARAKAASCAVLMLTVDMPVPGTRYRDYRSGLAGSAGWAGAARRVAQALCRPAWAWDVGVRGRPHTLGNVAPLLGRRTGLEDFFAWMRNNFDPSVTWKDLDFVREHWDGPLVLKGILNHEDARAAVSFAVDGIVVSNHGGRQLDSAPSTVRALPAIADACGHRLTVLADGGVRSGLDVVKLLALGADGVLLGRAWIYALASAGQAGVVRLLQLMESEMRVAMALTGVTSIAGIDRAILAE